MWKERALENDKKVAEANNANNAKGFGESVGGGFVDVAGGCTLAGMKLGSKIAGKPGEIVVG